VDWGSGELGSGEIGSGGLVEWSDVVNRLVLTL
jgi:hypothetical protein